MVSMMTFAPAATRALARLCSAQASPAAPDDDAAVARVSSCCVKAGKRIASEALVAMLNHLSARGYAHRSEGSDTLRRCQWRSPLLAACPALRLTTLCKHACARCITRCATHGLVYLELFFG